MTVKTLLRRPDVTGTLCVAQRQDAMLQSRLTLALLSFLSRDRPFGELSKATAAKPLDTEEEEAQHLHATD